MGLDNYASRTPDWELSPEDEAAFEAARIGLASGPTGLRGKIYDELVTKVTGVSLYQKWIPPEVVRQMWVELESCDAETVTAEEALRDRSVSDVEELRRFFRICVERNLGLFGDM
jgi:hypothetical protein